MKYFLPILILLSLINCQNVAKNQLPYQLLTEDQMINLLIDVSQIKTLKSNHLADLKASGIIPDEYICNKHDIDSITLSENLKYYGYEPDRLKSIYKKVLDSLNKSHNQIKEYVAKKKKEFEIKRKKEEEQRKKDSLIEIKRLDSISKKTKTS